MVVGDLAGHLEGIWKNTCKAAKLLLEGPIPDEFELPDVQTAIERWLETDRLFHAIQSFPSPRHEAQDS